MPSKKRGSPEKRSNERTALFSIFVLGLAALMGLFFWFRDYRAEDSSTSISSAVPLGTAGISGSPNSPLVRLLTPPSPLALRQPQGGFPTPDPSPFAPSAGANTVTPPAAVSSMTKDPFGEAELVYSEESQPDATGAFNRLRVVRTSMKYSLIRVEEKLTRDSNGEEKTVARSAMVADHILLHLEPGYTSEDLSKVARSLGAEVRRAVPISGIYLVSFDIKDPHAMEKILAELKHSPMVNTPEPDYVIRVN